MEIGPDDRNGIPAPWAGEDYADSESSGATYTTEVLASETSEVDVENRSKRGDEIEGSSYNEYEEVYEENENDLESSASDTVSEVLSMVDWLELKKR